MSVNPGILQISSGIILALENTIFHCSNYVIIIFGITAFGILPFISIARHSVIFVPFEGF